MLRCLALGKFCDVRMYCNSWQAREMAFFLQDKSGDILYFSYWRQIPMKRQKTTTDPTNKYSLWSQSLIHVVAISLTFVVIQKQFEKLK